MNYVTIDFETAYLGKGSACALAISTSNGETIIDEWYHFIKPYSMRFDLNNVRINGIYPDMVESEPTFPYYFVDIYKRLEGQIVFAHNARFDMSVLADALALYDLPEIPFFYGDTVAIARKLWKNLSNHKLNTVAAYLHFDFTHHQAMEDAYACEWIVRQALKETGTITVEDMMNELNLPLKAFSIKKFLLSKK